MSRLQRGCETHQGCAAGCNRCFGLFTAVLCGIVCVGDASVSNAICVAVLDVLLTRASLFLGSMQVRLGFCDCCLARAP